MSSTGFVPLPAVLRQLLTPPALPRPGERCDVCRARVSDAHGHVVDVRTRRLLCVCEICCIIEGRYRRVPSRYVHLPSMVISDAQWHALAIPVDLVFFFLNSDLARWVACYPGPAGVTESVLPLETWPALVDANPWIDLVAPDVEGLLVRRIDNEYRCFLAPITACYELAGRIRAAWTGLSGGDSVPHEIHEFFARILERSQRADPHHESVLRGSAEERT